MDTAIDIRRRALEEAAVEMCGYCRGAGGHDPVPVEQSGVYVHLFTRGNGSNPCSSAKIWTMIAEAKMERELLRNKPAEPSPEVAPTQLCGCGHSHYDDYSTFHVDCRHVNLYGTLCKCEEFVPAVAPMQEAGMCVHCGKPLKMSSTSGKYVWYVSEDGWCKFECPATKGLHSPVPAVAPRETQTECRHNYEEGVLDGRMVRHCRKCGDTYGPFDVAARVEDNAKQGEPIVMFCCDLCGFKGNITFAEMNKHRSRCAAQPAKHTDDRQVAQPVEGPRLHTYSERGHCSYCGAWKSEERERCMTTGDYVTKWAAAPVEGVERVTDDRPSRVCAKNALAAELDDEFPDDRQADTIPDDLKADYQRACMQHKGHRGYVRGLIERIGRAEANIARRKDAAMKVTGMYQRLDKHCAGLEERTGRAETRIEVLEAALRDFLDHLDRGVHCCVVTDFQTRKLRAALAAPSGEPPE